MTGKDWPEETGNVCGSTRNQHDCEFPAWPDHGEERCEEGVIKSGAAVALPEEASCMENAKKTAPRELGAVVFLNAGSGNLPLSI